MGVGLRLELVVVLGLAEGSDPAPVADDSVLPDHERQATGGELELRADGTERQHRELLATLAGADRHLLCVPRGDLRRSADRVPSRWVAELAGRLAGEPVHGSDLPPGQQPWLEEVASFDAGLRALTVPATEQEYRLRALLASTSVRSGGDASGHTDAVLDTAMATVRARRSPRFTRYDGNLAGLPVPSPADLVTSATRLEGWAGCPFAYFVREILRVEPVENPEDRLRISPLDLGTLVHEILERFLDEVLARDVAARPRPDEPWSEADRRRLYEIAADACARTEAHGLVGRPIFWQRDRHAILADLDRFLRADSAHRAATGTSPMAAELAFGMPGSDLGPVALPLPDGRAVRFRGKADRLDRSDEGALEIVDYKTGSKRNYKALSEVDPDDGGRRLQLPVYALAARARAGAADAPVRAQYWFVSMRGDFSRIGYPVTDAVLAHVGQTVLRIVEGIEAGVFPAVPTVTSTSIFVDCPYCDPDALGVTDLQRQLLRKAGDPALAPYFALVGDRRGEDDDAAPVAQGASGD
jgi:RecB family exonuclease